MGTITMTISENTTVEKALKMSKNIIRVFRKYNLYCPECKGNREDTVKMVALNNGLNIKKFLKELNEALKKS
jgi:hypothetical protein